MCDFLVERIFHQKLHPRLLRVPANGGQHLRAGQAGQMGMDREFMRTVLQAIHEESIRQQMEVLGK